MSALTPCRLAWYSCLAPSEPSHVLPPCIFSAPSASPPPLRPTRPPWRQQQRRQQVLSWPATLPPAGRRQRRPPALMPRDQRRSSQRPRSRCSRPSGVSLSPSEPQHIATILYPSPCVSLISHHASHTYLICTPPCATNVCTPNRLPARLRSAGCISSYPCIVPPD